MKRFLSMLVVAILLICAIGVGVAASEPTAEEILAERQQIAMDHMREMTSVIWRATEDIDYITSSKIDPQDVGPGEGTRFTLKAGRLYRGIPYSYSGSAGESFLDFGTDADGDGILEISGLSWRALSGNSSSSARIGNDCSGAVNHAWGRFGAHNRFATTRYYTAAQGFLKVGEYDDYGVEDYSAITLEDGTEGTKAICKLNGTDVIYEAYTHLRPADAVVRYTGGGHVMMITQVNVVRTEDGKVDPNLSTVTVLQQTRSYSTNSVEAHYFDEELQEEVYQIGGVDDVFTFRGLFREDYLPFTCKELRDPAPIPEFYLEDSITEYNADTIVDGIISSNRIIDSATMTITDASGKEIQKGTVYTKRTTDTEFYGLNMRQFVDDGYHTMRGYVNPYALPAGRYHCNVVCRINGIETFTVRDFDFDWTPIGERTTDHSSTFCAVCGYDNVTWEPLPGDITEKTYLNGPHQHYYLDRDISNKLFYHLSTAGSTVCLDLNGHTITGRQRGFRIDADCTLNVFGKGGVYGAVSTANKGACFDVSGRLNLFSGNYKLAKVVEYPVIATSAFGARVDMYDGVTIEGRSDVNISSVRLERGIFNMHGGIVTGGYAENGGNFLVGYKGGDATDGSDTYACNLNVFGGTIQNGTATGRGGNVYVVNEGVAAFYKDALITGGTAANGGNIEAYAGGYVTINGSTVRDGHASSRGGNLYAYGVGVMAEIVINDAIIENGAAAAAGGNIEAYGGKITLNNTIVRDGKTENASTYGGNIDVRKAGTVIFNSGELYDGYGVRRGGNVAATSEGTFIMNGGRISGGSVGGNGTYGKSVFLYSDGNMIMKGGRIETAATTNGYGNGIYVYDDSMLTLAGDATVSGLQGIYSVSGVLRVDNSYTGSAGIRWSDTTLTEGMVLAESTAACGQMTDSDFVIGGSFTGKLNCETLTHGCVVGVDGAMQVVITGHTWDAGVYTDPTTEADGYTTFTCTVCGETRTETDEGSKLPEIIPAAITKQPEAVTAESGETVQFHVEAQGEVVSYKWEYRSIYKWFNTTMTGYNTDTLTVAVTGARNGYDYRCIITFADGTVLTSEIGVLTAITYITEIGNPNDQTVVLGYYGQFTASAVGEGLKYQWYFKRPNDDRWAETAMSGSNKPTVMIETTTARDGYQYKCKITDVTGNVVYTEPATMRILSFTSNPKETFAATGSTVTFSVTASVDSGFTYQWQYSKDGVKWTNTTMTGCYTDTLTVQATKARNGYMYRCQLTGSKNSKIESKPAILHVGDPVAITAQPQSVTAAAGEVTTFTVEADNAYSYQWQYARKGSTSFANTSLTGATTKTLTVDALANRNGYQYRCEIKGLDGNMYYTEVAVLTVQ